MLARSVRWTRLGAVCVLTLALAACAVRGGAVTPAGADECEVSYNAGLRNTSWVELKNIALRAAEDHCTSLGRKLVDPRVTSNGATDLIPKKATVRFSCQPVAAAK